MIAASTLMREAAAAFAARGFGSIITISSWAGQQGSRIPELGGYAASKAAIRNFGQSLARAYARDGVRVYTIAPGVVDAGMGTAGKSADEIRSVADGLTMGRHVEAQEIAELRSVPRHRPGAEPHRLDARPQRGLVPPLTRGTTRKEKRHP